MAEVGSWKILIFSIRLLVGRPPTPFFQEYTHYSLYFRFWSGGNTPGSLDVDRLRPRPVAFTGQRSNLKQIRKCS